MTVFSVKTREGKSKFLPSLARGLEGEGVEDLGDGWSRIGGLWRGCTFFWEVVERVGEMVELGWVVVGCVGFGMG